MAKGIVRRVVLPLGIATGMVVAGASSATAHDVRQYINACGSTGATCGYAEVRNSHRTVYACDTRSDGHGVYVAYRLRSGATGTQGDGNGASSGCGQRTVGTSSNPVVSFQACVNRSDLGRICNAPINA